MSHHIITSIKEPHHHQRQWAATSSSINELPQNHPWTITYPTMSHNLTTNQSPQFHLPPQSSHHITTRINEPPHHHQSLSCHIFTHEPSHIQQCLTASPPISHHSSYYEPQTSHHIINKPPHRNHWASYSIRHHISNNEPAMSHQSPLMNQLWDTTSPLISRHIFTNEPAMSHHISTNEPAMSQQSLLMSQQTVGTIIQSVCSGVSKPAMDAEVLNASFPENVI